MPVIAAVTCQMLILYIWHFQNFISGYLQSQDPDNSHSWTSPGSQCNIRPLLSSQDQRHRYTVFLPHWPSFETSQFCSHKVRGKNIVQDDNSTELKLYVLMLNQKQQIIFFAWFRKLRGFKSNKLKIIIWLSKCQMLLNLNNLQHRLTFLLCFLLQISFNQVSVKKVNTLQRQSSLPLQSYIANYWPGIHRLKY